MDLMNKEQEICSNALKLFARYGYGKTTVEDVAGAMGMTKSNLYFYFKSKRDLYEKTVATALSGWRDSVAKAVFAQEDVVEKFRTMAHRSFDYLTGHPELRTILENDPGIFTLTPSEDRFYDVNRGAMDMLDSVLRQGIREARFYPVDVQHMTEFLFSVYIMFLIRAYVKSEGSIVATMYNEAVELAVRGLCIT